MAVNSALALVPAMDLRIRDTSREVAALVRLARWLGRFTPAVSIDPPNALLLEIRGSLKLFGGLSKLRAALRAGLHRRGHVSVMACTPTALASLWLARAGLEPDILALAELPRLLASVPVRHLGWPGSIQKALAQTGVTTLGDCLRLPRQGFARRFGPGLLRELDQGLGRSAEVRRHEVFPVHFRDSLELPADTADTMLLLEGFRILGDRLQACLRSRQAGVRTLWCHLHHPEGADTRLRISLRQASADISLFLGILRLRLDAGALPGVATRLMLEADLVGGSSGSGTDLLGKPLHPDEGLPGLLERLRGRLGRQAVHGLALVPEHRPERAWRPVGDPLEAGASAAVPLGRGPPRPSWLLPEPRSLLVLKGHPAFQGVLCIEGGPERIETGWWDGADVRRDYYVAINRQGARLWIYQDLRSSGWYLHGIF
jgi:protein ImuB